MSRRKVPQPLKVVPRGAEDPCPQPRLTLPGEVSALDAVNGHQIATRLLADFIPSSCPPLSGAEPTFTAPWEARAFSMAVALQDAQALEWREFQNVLGRALDRQAKEQREDEWSYYIPWLCALEALLVGREQIDPDLLKDRTLEILARSNHQHLTQEAKA